MHACMRVSKRKPVLHAWVRLPACRTCAHEFALAPDRLDLFPTIFIFRVSRSLCFVRGGATRATPRPLHSASSPKARILSSAVTTKMSKNRRMATTSVTPATTECELYGLPACIVLESFVHAMRNNGSAVKTLLSAHPTDLTPSDFQGIQELTNTQFTATGNAFAFEQAQDAAAEWLFGKALRPLASMTLLFERAFIDMCIRDPEELTTNRVLDDVGIKGHNAYLTDGPSKDHTAQTMAVKRGLLSLMDDMKDLVTPETQVSSDVLRWTLECDLKGAHVADMRYPIDQMNGVQSYLPWFMTDIHCLNDSVDVEHFIARLSALAAKFDTACEEAKRQRQCGIVPPLFVLDKVIESLQEVIDQDSSNNSMVLHLRQTVQVKSIQVESDAMARAEAAVRDDVIPAYVRMRDTLTDLRASASETAAGYCHFHNGNEYYSWRLRSETSTSLTPEEVHRIGIHEVTSIESSMRKCLVEHLKHPEDVDVIAFMRSIDDQKDVETLFYPNTDQGREECLAHVEALVDEVSTLVKPHFDVMPRGALQVRRVAPHMESGSPVAFYMPPSMDHTRPGVYYINLGDMKMVQKWGLRTLTAHEAIPGHHFQLALANENESLPHFRRGYSGFNAFVEGWGLYSEKVGLELGFYKTTHDVLGHYGDELFRAARLVVDTGLHAMKWTRDEAIEYMMRHTTLPRDDIQGEVNRYCVFPGQACGYKIGLLEMLRMRQLAKDRSSGSDSSSSRCEDWDCTKFHSVVLTLGSAPLEVLRDAIEREFPKK